jgi:hypothetical protein
MMRRCSLRLTPGGSSLGCIEPPAKKNAPPTSRPQPTNWPERLDVAGSRVTDDVVMGLPFGRIRSSIEVTVGTPGCADIGAVPSVFEG